jgi:hypothetical protein
VPQPLVVKLKDKDVLGLFDATETLATYGIRGKWSVDALRVAVMARLPRSADRKRLESLADRCTTHSELVKLAAATLEAFKTRRTSLLPPPPGEEDCNDRESDLEDGLRTPYVIK